MRKSILLILSLISFCCAFAQYESAGMPLKYTPEKQGMRRSVANFFVNLNADTTKISLETSNRMYVTGVTAEVDIDINKGKTFIENGLKISRVGVYSKNAKGISLFFDKFLLPDGGKLFVYNPNQTIVYGAFTSKNNNDVNKLLIRPLPSDSIIVEYQEPLDAPFEADLHISLATHELRTLKNFMTSNQCTQFANSQEGIEKIKQSVCLLYMVGSASSSCGSGALINNPEHKPYIYTAGHNLTDADLATRTIYYFNYEVSAQDNAFQGSTQFTISGSKLLSRDTNVDFALAELNKMPPAEYRPYFAGWTRDTNPTGPFKGIQHPNADVKKVSYTSSVQSSYYETPSVKTYWYVRQWDDGITEVGSSGSPLFDADGHIIGELTGGASFCNTPYNDYYCQFHAAWDYYKDESKQLAKYLDPKGENPMSMDGYEPYPRMKRISNIENTDNVAINRAGKTPLVGHNSYKIKEFAEKFELNTPAYVYGTYIMPYKGKYNSNVPVKVNIYAGDDKPIKLLSTAIVHPTEALCYRSGTFSESNISNYKEREIYVSLPEPVLVEENLFVSLQVQYENMTSSDTLLVASVVGKDDCTAYFYDNGWKSYNEHPYGSVNLSIWVDPVIETKEVVSIEETKEAKNNYAVYPNPTHGNVVVTPSFDGEYKLFDMTGKVVSAGEYDSQINISGKGIYILELLSNSGEKGTHKIICY